MALAENLLILMVDIKGCILIGMNLDYLLLDT